MPEKFSLKDHLFNQTKVSQIASEIFIVYPKFNKKNFAADVVRKFPDLELKARIAWISECLKKYLPDDYKRAVSILIKALPGPNNPKLSDNDFGDFIYAPYAEYVARNGCTKEYVQCSLNALYEITQRFSVEDAIRFFINVFPQETLSELLNWTTDSHYHVRRLCSEGTRPKLPWSQKINILVTVPLPILNNLFSDTTRFVTRSVANHLNDISKTDPNLVVDTLSKWRKSGKQKPEEMDYIIHHALRTLIKQGNLKAMQLLEFSHEARVNVSDFIVPKKVKMNSTLKFYFTIEAQDNTDIIADYIVYFQNKSGKMNSKKFLRLRKFLLRKIYLLLFQNAIHSDNL